MKSDKEVHVCKKQHPWQSYSLEGPSDKDLDRIEFIDFDTDPYDHISRIQLNRIDMFYRNTGNSLMLSAHLVG